MLAHAAHAPDETDDGPKGRRAGSARLCIVTRVSGEPSGLLRFVVGPDGAVVPDLKAILPGRGAWVSADKAVLKQAVAKKAFSRAFKREVKASPDLPDQVEALLLERTLAALSLANKAGEVITGFDSVASAIGAGRVAGLLHARDAGADGVKKLFAACLRRSGDVAKTPPRWTFFESAQLDLALGRQNVIHAALLEGPAAGAFVQRCAILDRFRGENPAIEQGSARSEPVPGTTNEDA